MGEQLTGGHLRDEDLVGLLRDEMRQDQAYAWLVHCESCGDCNERLARFRAVHDDLGGLVRSERPQLPLESSIRARQAAAQALAGSTTAHNGTSTSTRMRVVRQEMLSQWGWVAAAAASVLIGTSLIIAEAVSHTAHDEVSRYARQWQDIPVLVVPAGTSADDDPARPSAPGIVSPRVTPRTADARPTRIAPADADPAGGDDEPLTASVELLLAGERSTGDTVGTTPDLPVTERASSHLAYLDAANGTVEMCHDGDAEWREVTPGAPIVAGDRLRTTMSRARVSFYSGTTMDINRYTQLSFGEHVWPSGVSVVKGEIYVETADLDTGFFVDTPHGRAVDLGTKFDVGVGPVTGTSVLVVQGRVEASTEIATARLESGTEVQMASRRSAPGDVKTVFNLQKRLAWTTDIPGNLPRTFASANLAKGIVGYWRFDEGHGPLAYDASPSGLVAKLTGTGRTVGYVGGSLYFDGAHSYATVDADEALDITGGVTIGAWIRIDRITASSRIASRDDGVAGGYKLCLDNGRVDFAVILPAAVAPATARARWLAGSGVGGGRQLGPGRWYHVLGTYSDAGDYIRTYVDGILDRQMATDASLELSAGPLYIGRQSFANAWHFSGQIDELTLFDRALTDTEIAMLARWPTRR